MIYLIKQDWVYVRTKSTLDSFTPVTVKRTISDYRKIQEISPGAYIFQRPFLRGLFLEGQLRFKIDWASLIVGMKFTNFACFSLYLRQFPSTSPPGGEWGAYIWRGDLTEGFLRYEFGVFILGAFTWRGLFSEFYGISHSLIISKELKHMLINDKSLRLYGNFYR